MLSEYVEWFGNSTPYADQAIMLALVFQQLMLQKPHKAPESCYVKCLKRRMESWRKGHIHELFHESETIQTQTAKWQDKMQRNAGDPEAAMAANFARLVTNGKLGSALRMLVEEQSGGPLQLGEHIGNERVRDILKSKHPEAAPVYEDAVLHDNPSPPPHPVRFEVLTTEVIQKASLHTFGSAGPSGVDAESWRHMCTSFGEASDCLCDAIALCSRRLAPSYINPSSLEAFLSCRLIPLDKNPGVRPIGIGEVLRRIIGIAVLYIIGDDIHDAVGSLQLCTGHDNGIEAAIHAMRKVVDNPATEAILLAEASNAFF